MNIEGHLRERHNELYEQIVGFAEYDLVLAFATDCANEMARRIIERKNNEIAEIKSNYRKELNK